MEIEWQCIVDVPRHWWEKSCPLSKIWYMPCLLFLYCPINILLFQRLKSLGCLVFIPEKSNGSYLSYWYLNSVLHAIHLSRGCIHFVCRWSSDWQDHCSASNYDISNIHGSEGGPNTHGWLSDLCRSLVNTVFALWCSSIGWSGKTFEHCSLLCCFTRDIKFLLVDRPKVFKK